MSISGVRLISKTRKEADKTYEKIKDKAMHAVVVNMTLALSLLLFLRSPPRTSSLFIGSHQNVRDDNTIYSQIHITPFHLLLFPPSFLPHFFSALLSSSATMEKILLLQLIYLTLSVTITGILADESLISPSKLKMFVDELQNMPKIQGFEFVNGKPISKKLRIGMYHKKWV